MKKTLTQICLLIGLLIGLMISAQAQSQTQYRARIGFDFAVGDQNLPAGDYVFGLTNPDSSNQTLTIRALRGGKSRIVLITPKINDTRLAVSKLVFNRYGEQYFLAEIAAPTLAAKFQTGNSENRLSEMQKAKPEVVAITNSSGQK